MSRRSLNHRGTNLLDILLGVVIDKPGRVDLATTKITAPSIVIKKRAKCTATISMLKAQMMRGLRLLGLRVRRAAVGADVLIAPVYDRWNTCNNGIAAVYPDTELVF
jgi:hypothetical protein